MSFCSIALAVVLLEEAVPLGPLFYLIIIPIAVVV